jgi:formyltetrahydrofolate deformylase
MTDQTFVLTLTCPDRAGIVHAVTGLLVEHRGNIVESQQFSDLAEDRFFMRVKFAVDRGATVTSLRAAFAPVAERWGMDWELWLASAPYRTLVLVSKFSHCLNDLLFRWSSGSLQIDVAGVVSNHPDCETLVRSYGVPYHHVPVTPETKADAEAKLLLLVDTLDVDLVVLARYMQVLSDETCRALSGKAINIHHSFLPSFKGARPYHQAFDRGVKLVGATAHYVTGDLDEGPIIEQDVMRVDHGYDAAALAAAGRDVESQVLSRAVRWHAESRVLLNGHKTVVFR